MYTVSPREGERYFLRLLLLHVTEAESFLDMRTVDGEVCSSFRQACGRRGLLGDDAEWRRVLRESFSSEFVMLTSSFRHRSGLLRAVGSTLALGRAQEPICERY